MLGLLAKTNCSKLPNRNETRKTVCSEKMGDRRSAAIGGRHSGGAVCFWWSAPGSRQSALVFGSRVENSAVGAHHSSPQRRSLAVGYSESLQS